MAPLVGTLALLAMTVATAAIKEVPLDMAPNSFDDQYQNCGHAMISKMPNIKNFEFKKNQLFTQVWTRTTVEWKKRGSPVSPMSHPDQAIAVLAYSSKYIYKAFNDAVRVAGRSRQVYRDQFHFKALHFLLTKALVQLRSAQNGQCRHVFRGVHDIRFLARRGQKVRFGQFTSTSLSKEIALKYGTDTIFQVYTCHGADIQAFSLHYNREVLIPPYETFEVTQVTKKGKSTWISLRSSGTYSKHNCALL